MGYLNKIILCLVMLACLLPNCAYSQGKGDFVLSFGYGLLTKGGLSIKYYVFDGVGLEVCSGAVPHIYNLGAYINIYPRLRNKRVYFITGYSMFGGGGRFYDEDKIFSEHPDTLLPVGSNASGITLGIGYEKLKENINDNGKLYYSSYFLSLGPTYVLKHTQSLINSEGTYVKQPPPNKMKWAFFLEGGYGRYFK